MTNDPSACTAPANGRKIVLVVVAVAFIASATTAMLAFTASHRARDRDAKALAADTADLRGELNIWHAQLADARGAAPASRGPYLDRLVSRTRELSAWKPRTPCGRDARDRLVRAMEDRARVLLSDAADASLPGEGQVLETALSKCEAERGRDVTI
ncbi:hypothetical protein [Luteibacter yeojuensis]|uniref:Uncharacterized protein n=1 Tax=Luteibacter yeojuensis TaxID=345309 RepID=A0A7X5TR89_9GAMM|nr:hypothetical protein [Luteibacter yeojuensis]NID16910.1 hypothetical protein [Luteibacter yeojuensis]